MARGRSTRGVLAAGAAPRPHSAPAPAAFSPARALAAIAAELPASRLEWCPPQTHPGTDGRPLPSLGAEARRHEALVRHAGVVIEQSARRLAVPEIARLAARLRALEAAEAAHGGPDPETEAHRRRIMDHELPAARQRALIRALGAVRPLGAPPGSTGVHRFAPGSDRAACDLVEQASGLFPRDWLARSRADSAIVPLCALLGQAPGRARPRGWRGSYEHALEASVLRLDEAAPASPAGAEQAAHELTHRMEALVPGLERLSWAFRARVAEDGGSDEPGYRMRVYGADGPEASSELLAVGVQALAASPARFERVLGQDAEYRHFVLGALALT